MKIKLKLSPDQILNIDRLLSSLFGEVKLMASISIQDRVVASLGLELSDIFHTRARKMIREANLFQNNKRARSLTLKYHQAWALEQLIIAGLNKLENNEYRTAILMQLANEINQKIV